MKKLLFVVLLFAGITHAQNLGVRIDRDIIRAENNVSRFLIYDTGTISFCAAPADGVPCTNKATTYTDSSLGTPCSTSTQLVLAGTDACVSGTDSEGNWGVWVPGGQYEYTITFPDGSSEGPFPVTAGSGSTVAATHNLLSTTHPDTTPASVVRGDLIIGQGVSPKWARKAIGANGTALCSDGTDANWGTCFNNSLIEQIVPPRTDLSYVILYPTSYSQYGALTDYGQTSAGNSSGYIQRIHSAALGDWDVWITWTGFSLPASVTPSSVQYVYGVTVSQVNVVGYGLHEQNFCQGAISYNGGVICTGTGHGIANSSFGQQNVLIASPLGAGFDFSTVQVGLDNAATTSFTIQDDWNVAVVALVVFYSGTQVPLSSAIEVVPPLYYNQELNTLSYGSSVGVPPFGTVSLPTVAIPSGSCGTTATVSAPGTTVSDTPIWSYSSDPSGVTGYGVSASGHLDIYAWPTTDNVNFVQCNSTGGSITPGSMKLNWRIGPR